ncbi:RNA-directed DNA polymerase from mobile element jockey [Caerostris darwini]|uniref:RNA-directed DNA polymerase from mobile element jockey n=1 Tax=Caerostris darwini TaxID=1538125 RepID=A0AAV4S9N2_9ARAC|nr:RNA-directed DNA polymerase from mobile element jockey [Caerostris darwini]
MRIHNKSLNITFWNANGIKKRKIELHDFIINHSPDLLLIQETHLQPQDNFFLPNFHGYRNDRINPLQSKAAGGTAIFIKNHLPYHHVPTPPLQHIEASIISLNLPNLDPIIIASIYVPVNSDPHLFTIDLEAIMQLGANVIMCGDYNAHHMQWKCNNNNARGLQLLNFAIKTDLDIIAPNSPTRYGHNSTSTIDLAVIKNFLFPYQISSIAELSSDHNPVELTFNFDYLIPTENSNIFTNWTLFTKFLTSIHAKPLPTITSTFTLDEEINKFTNDLLTARQNASKPATNDKKPWTHPNIKKLLQVRNKAKKKWQTTRNPNDKTILNRIHKNIKNAFKRYSDNKWKETLEDLQIEDGSFWKMTKRFKLPFIKMSHLQGTISTAIKDQDKAELIAQNLENQFTLNDISDPMQEYIIRLTAELDLIDYVIRALGFKFSEE